SRRRSGGPPSPPGAPPRAGRRPRRRPAFRRGVGCGGPPVQRRTSRGRRAGTLRRTRLPENLAPRAAVGRASADARRGQQLAARGYAELAVDVGGGGGA